MKKHSTQQQAALAILNSGAAATSWDFGSGTVSWLRKRGYVLSFEELAVKGYDNPGKLVITEAGKEACARGAT